MSETEHCTDHWINRGRLALALVSARGKQCPQRKCRRKGGHCIARFGKGRDNFHQPAGPCPIMADAEWRAISLGMQMNGLRQKPWIAARVAARAAAEPQISWEEQVRRYNSPEEVEKRAEAERRKLAHPGYPAASSFGRREPPTA